MVMMMKTMIKKRVMTKGAEKIRKDIQKFTLGENASMVTFHMAMMRILMILTMIKKKMMTKGAEKVRLPKYLF